MLMYFHLLRSLPMKLKHTLNIFIQTRTPTFNNIPPRYLKENSDICGSNNKMQSVNFSI